LVLPKGIAASGFPRVRETCRRIGIGFDPWQTDLNRCILAKSPDGQFAADTAVMSIPRQVGKTFDVGAVVFAECIAEPGTTVIWTAHRFKVARETFDSLRALAASPRLSPHIDYDEITTGAGNEQIPFRNGSRIVFAARERGAIRGFTKVRILVLDEAQILSESALSDLVPTMNQAHNPLILLMGTPPKPSDPSEVFTNLRREALAGTSEGVLYVEFSADPGSDPDDRAAWRKANPSYPSRTPARAILRMKKLLSEADFLREALGIWDDDAAGEAAIPFPLWQRLADPASVASGPVRLSLEVSQDRKWACVGAAGLRADGSLHVQVAENHPGTDWVVDKLAELAPAHGGKVVLSPNSPAGTFTKALETAGVGVIPVPTGQYAAACGAFFDGVAQSRVFHLSQPELDAAVRGARRKTAGDAWVFDRRRPSIDISPLAAVTLAAWSATTLTLPPRNAGRGRVIALT
jgi:hypothetical protein